MHVGRILLLLCVLGAANVLLGQDVIHKVSGEEIRGRVMEVGPSTVSYKKMENPKGPSYKLEKDSVAMIEYANGTKDVFETKEKKEEADINYFIKGQRDADRFYQDYKTASVSTLIVSLLSPLVGLIPALATSLSRPKEVNLGFPDTKLFKRKDYRRGYKLRAKKIKSRKVWTNWGVALGVNFLIVLFMASSQ